MSSPAVGPDRPATAPARRLVVAAFSGTAIEYYDFLAYAIAASTVFGVLFFPSDDEVVGVLLALGSFAAGFLMRPIGGIVAGHFGDKLGRKNMLVFTMVLMSAATMLIGLLPTYDQVGIWAPIALVVLRLVQGFAAGGEFGGAALMAIEHAPRHKRTLYGSWPSVGTAIGGLLAIVAFAALAGLPKEDFLSWGWRIPFLASVVLFAISFYVRRRIPETPEFVAMREEAARNRLPLRTVLRRYPTTVLLTAGSIIGFTGFTYLAFTFLITYGTSELGVPRQQLLVATMIGLVLVCLWMPGFAALADRVGKRRVMLGGYAFLLVYPFVLFPLVQTRDFAVIVLAVVLAYAGASAAQGPVAALFADQFSTGVRYSGVSLGYQVGSVLGGGLTPVLATGLYAASGGNVTLVAAYAAGIALLSAVCVVLLRRRPERSDAEHEDTDRATPAATA